MISDITRFCFQGMQSAIPEPAPIQFDSIKTRAVGVDGGAAAEAAVASARGGFYPLDSGYKHILQYQKIMLVSSKHWCQISGSWQNSASYSVIIHISDIISNMHYITSETLHQVAV